MRDERKGQMAIEYIVKLIIVLVVISVVIGMILTFKGDTLKKWKLVSDPGREEPEPNAAFVDIGTNRPPGEFAAEMARYIELCWAETRDMTESKVCFVIKGTHTGTVLPADITAAITTPGVNVDLSGANLNTEDLFSINHIIIGDKIEVKS
ncbi:MAG: hypothetical protein ABIG84_07395 [archaeon]